MDIKKGDSNKLSIIIQALLEMKTILYLPKTFIVNNPDNHSDYFSSIDSKVLLYLVKDLNLENTKIIEKLFGGPVLDKPPTIPNNTPELQDKLNAIKPNVYSIEDNIYYNQFLEMNNSIELLESQMNELNAQITMENEQLSHFKCIDENSKYDFIGNFILNCSEFCSKNVNWYRVILGLDKLDKDFENDVKNILTDLNIYFEYNVLEKYMNLLSENTMLKNMLKDRIVECSNSPYTFWDKLTGSISFASLSECNLCKNDCILYLNNSYKNFLTKDIPGLDVTMKLKILVYCEHRLYNFCKYITLEAIRIKGRKYTRVKNILKSLDKKNNSLFIKKQLKRSKKHNEHNLNKMNQAVTKLKGGTISNEQVPEEAPEQATEIIDEDNTLVYKQVLPNCDNIVDDIKNNRIHQQNFMYLSGKCNNHIMTALE